MVNRHQEARRRAKKEEREQTTAEDSFTCKRRKSQVCVIFVSVFWSRNKTWKFCLFNPCRLLFIIAIVQANGVFYSGSARVWEQLCSPGESNSGLRCPPITKRRLIRLTYPPPIEGVLSGLILFTYENDHVNKQTTSTRQVTCDVTRTFQQISVCFSQFQPIIYIQ